MKRFFYIESKAGVIFGIYKGNSKAGALRAMVKESGDQYDEDEYKTDDWIIIEVVGVEKRPDIGVTIYTLLNGATVVDDGYHRYAYYRGGVDEALEDLMEN